MINFIYQIIRTARPRQWLKNLSVFAAPVFTGRLFVDETLLNTTRAFIAFCIVASGVYFLNDLKDAPQDRLHPIKKNRPIASGKISPMAARLITLILLTGGLIYAQSVGTYFFWIMALYLAIQFSYSYYFRNVIILDSLLVASGFILRVFAGGIAGESSISSWLILTTIGLSLLLAFGKRRSERTLLLEQEGSSTLDTRKTLRHYPDSLLDSMISMSASFCIITYALFAFQTSPEMINQSLIAVLPSIFRTPKWMMLTIPIVIYGVARYLYVIYETKNGESPERVLLSDKPLLTAVVVWGTSIFGLVYLLPLIV